MDIIKKMFKELGDMAKNDIYLREIALLMEEKDTLEGKVRKKENLIKNFEKQIKGKKWEQLNF